MSPRLSAGGERRLLQISISLAASIPVLVGLAGLAGGLSAVDTAAGWSLDGDSHVRYLSGLLLAIGLAFLSTVPSIEATGARFRLLTGLIVAGGLGRLSAAVLVGLPGPAMRVGLALELVAAPLLALWRERLERRLKLGPCRP